MRNEADISTETEVLAFCDGCRLVPVSHLSLDLDVPVGGWEMFLSEQGIDVMLDDLGRASIARSVFGALVKEQATMRKFMSEWAALAAAEMAQAARKTPVYVGLAAIEGLSAHEVMAAAGDYRTPRDEFGNPRVNWLADELESSARLRSEEDEQAAREKARLRDQMRKDLQ